ncbi:hypothetical protein SRIMM317S_01243 [Streptomyces rimosus subsp. rimosus]
MCSPPIRGSLQLGQELVQHVRGVEERAVGACGGALLGLGPLAALGDQQPVQGLRGQLQDLFQGPYGAQRLGALGAPRPLLPVTQAGHSDLDPALRQLVLDAVQGQPAGGQGGPQRQVERAGLENLRQHGQLR